MRAHWITLVAAAALLAAAPSRAGNLDRALIARAGQLLEEAAGAGHRTIGVLPFRVKKGGRYAHAPLAQTLSGRLENALIVVQGGAERGAIRVLREPADPVRWSGGRDRLAELFAAERDLAWGGGRAKPDALLTGEVSCDGDRTSAVVTVDLLDPRSAREGGPAPRRLVRFRVDADVPLLRDLGYPFSLPLAAFKRGARPADAAALVATQVGTAGKSRVTAANVGGMRLEVEYDGVKQKVVGGPDRSLLPPPKAGQRVSLYLTRVSEEEGKLGAVVRVNGRSLFEEQDRDPVNCNKWTFEAGRRGLREGFTGFYSKTDDKLHVQPFRGLSGWLELDVFGLASGPDDRGVSTRALTAARARTLKELQTRLARANHLTLRRSVVSARSGGLLLLDVESAPAVATREQPLTLPLGGLTVWVGAPSEE